MMARYEGESRPEREAPPSTPAATTFTHEQADKARRDLEALMSEEVKVFTRLSDNGARLEAAALWDHHVMAIFLFGDKGWGLTPENFKKGAEIVAGLIT